MACPEKDVEHIPKNEKKINSYLGTSRASFFRKKLPTLKQNGGSCLEMFGFTVEKTAETPK